MNKNPFISIFAVVVITLGISLWASGAYWKHKYNKQLREQKEALIDSLESNQEEQKKLISSGQNVSKKIQQSAKAVDTKLKQDEKAIDNRHYNATDIDSLLSRFDHSSQ